MRMTRPLSRGVLTGIVAVGVALAGGAVVVTTQLSGPGSATDAAAAPTPRGSRTPGLAVKGLHHGKVPWNKKLRVEASNAAITSIRVMQKDGTVVDGTL